MYLNKIVKVHKKRIFVDSLFVCYELSGIVMLAFFFVFQNFVGNLTDECLR